MVYNYLKNTISLPIFHIITLFILSGDGANVTNLMGSYECLNVPHYNFLASLKELDNILDDLTAAILHEVDSTYEFDDFRYSSAISTCLDMSHLSVEELGWCVSAVENPQGKHIGSGDLSSDLQTWLSAIVANTITCTDQFDSSSNGKQNIISIAIQVNSFVADLLTKVNVPNHRGHLPSWVDSRDVTLLQTNEVNRIANVVVAADGTGNFTKVADAVSAAPNGSSTRYVIHIKKGVYIENVIVGENKWNLMMVGDGMDATLISGNLSVARSHLSTYNTATFGVLGKGFIAQGISFQNTAGPENNQSVALRSTSDFSVFYKCGIFGFQDSLYAHSNRQYYRECKISGTVDFIFGFSPAVFQECQILVKKGLPKQKNTITAQGGSIHNQPFGFSIQLCNISADSDLVPYLNSTKTYLGRPWKPYSRTIVMESYLGNVLSPEGWLEWDGDFALDTLYYAEYNNHGPGAGLQNRVKWQGYHILNDSSEAVNFTVANLISGDLWLPSTDVPFISGFGYPNTTIGK